MMPILELVHVVYALAHRNMAAVAGRSLPPWRELGTASSFAASPPNASSLHLGEHQLDIGGGEGLVWPAQLPCASATAPVRTGVPEGFVIAKTGCSKGLSTK